MGFNEGECHAQAITGAHMEGHVSVVCGSGSVMERKQKKSKNNGVYNSTE